MADQSLILAAVARPGDTILVGFSRELKDEDIEALDESFQPLVEKGIQVGYMDLVSSMVVTRPDGEE